MSLEDLKISEEELSEKGVSSLRNAPNRKGGFGTNGLTAQDLKERFDLLPRLIAARINLLIDLLAKGDIGAGGSGAGNVEEYDGAVSVDDDSTATFLSDYMEGYDDGYREGELAGGSGSSGGTTVTIGGEPQETFPADTYVSSLVRQLHAELVNNAPEALDTLYELAKALGDDPNFAAAMATELGLKAKAADLEALNAAYTAKVAELEAKKADTATVEELIAAAIGGAPEALDTLYELAKALGDDPNFATTVMTEIGKKIEKMGDDNKYRLYGKDYANAPYYPEVAYGNTGSMTIVQRNQRGAIKAADAVADNDVVPLAQLTQMLDERIGDISAALADAHAYAQSLINGGDAQ